MMDLQTIETAIRDALAKADAGDAKIRQRIYGTAWTAHERSLVSNPSLDSAERARRRDSLKALIGDIEGGFRSAGPVRTAPAQNVAAENSLAENVAALNATTRPATAPRGGGRVEPAFGEPAPARPGPASPRVEPRLDSFAASPRRRLSDEEPAFDGGEVANEVTGMRVSRDERVAGRGRRSRSWVGAVTLLALFVAVAAGIVWTLYNGIALPPSTHNNATPIPDGFSVDKSGGRTSAPEPKWLTVFQPTDPTHMSVQGAATAEIAKNGDEQFARLRSTSPDAEIRFDVGQGVLDKLGGGPVVFDLTMQAEGDKPTQVAVRCDFGSLASCDRKRYEVGITRQDYLLEVHLPAGVHPQSGGAVSVNTDIAGTGNAVDVFAIRVRSAR